MAQQPGLGVACVDVALNLDDGGDMRVPVGAGQLACGMEDGDGAAFVAVAVRVVAVGGPERCRRRGDVLDLLVQGRLVVLDLDDQADVGGCCGLEMIFWQCSASSVTMVPSATPSSARRVCAAGVSLDFSATSTWASTSAVPVANALSTCAAARSLNLSKLPRSVLPSSAMLPCPGVARAACSRAAWWRKAFSTAVGSRPWRIIADGGMRRCSAPVQAERRVQPVTVNGNEDDNTAIRVAAGHDGQDGEQQHVGQLVELPLRPARIRNVRQHVQQRRKRSHGNPHPNCRSRSQTLAGSGIPLAIKHRPSPRMCGRADPVEPTKQR